MAKQLKSKELFRKSSSDRFIPRRASMNIDISSYKLIQKELVKSEINSEKSYQQQYRQKAFKEKLKEVMLPKQKTVLSFSSPKIKKTNHFEPQDCEEWPVIPRSKPLITRPFSVLDLPFMEHLFHHRQLIDVNCNGIVAIVDGNSIEINDIHSTITQTLIPMVNYETKSVKWNSNGKFIGIGLNNSNVVVWNIKQNKVHASARCSCAMYAQTCEVQWMIWSKNNLLITGCSRGTLQIWESDLTVVKFISKAHGHGFRAMQFSNNEKYLASMNSASVIRLWYWPKLESYIEIVCPPEHHSFVWHPWKDSLILIYGASLLLWDINKAKVRCGKHVENRVDVASFNPLSGELVVSYKTNDESGNKILVYKDLSNTVDAIEYHIGRVVYLLWSKNGTVLVTVGADENFCLWDFFGAEKKRRLKRYKDQQVSLDIRNLLFSNKPMFGLCLR